MIIFHRSFYQCNQRNLHFVCIDLFLKCTCFMVDIFSWNKYLFKVLRVLVIWSMFVTDKIDSYASSLIYHQTSGWAMFLIFISLRLFMYVEMFSCYACQSLLKVEKWKTLSGFYTVLKCHQAQVRHLCLYPVRCTYPLLSVFTQTNASVRLEDESYTNRYIWIRKSRKSVWYS